MALDQSALLEIVEMMRSAHDGGFMRRLLRHDDASPGGCRSDRFIGAEPHQRIEDARSNATVNPRMAARARERYQVASSKDHVFDALTLADTLRHELALASSRSFQPCCRAVCTVA